MDQPTNEDTQEIIRALKLDIDKSAKEFDTTLSLKEQTANAVAMFAKARELRKLLNG